MSTSLQSHALNAYINQPTTAKSYPIHRKNNNRQNNPSEGETNCYINPATETLVNSQVILQQKQTPTSTDSKNRPASQLSQKTDNSDTTPPKENQRLHHSSHRNTSKQPSHQNRHTQITKTQTNPISKLRVDGEFKGWQRGWERGIQNNKRLHQPTFTNRSASKSSKQFPQTKQPLRRKSQLLHQTSYRNTNEQPSRQKNHTQITKTQTHPISKLRVDDGFTGWQRFWERGILLYPSEQKQSQPKNTAPHINF